MSPCYSLGPPGKVIDDSDLSAARAGLGMDGGLCAWHSAGLCGVKPRLAIERAKDITARRTLLVQVSFQSWETEAQRGDETC